MRKHLFLFGVIAASVAITGAAVAQEDLSSIDPSGQEVVYWHQFTGAQLETMTTLVEDFNSTNEYGITVNAIAQGGYNDIRELMNASIISGELPNLVAGYANDAASYFRDGGAVDLSPYVTDATWGLTEEQQADFVPGILDANRQTAAPFNGELLAWPHQFSAQVLVSNLDLLAELGYDAPPATLEEFREISCAAAESVGPNGEDRQGFPIIADASQLESFVANQGGVIFDGEQYTFTSEPVLNTLQLYSDLYSEGCGYIPAERFAEQTDLALGLNPFIVTSTAGFTFVRQAFVDAGVENPNLAVTTIPADDTANSALQVFVPSIILVPSTPEAQLASWLFLRYLVEPESAATWSSGSGYFNPVLSTAELVTEENFASPDVFTYYDTANSYLSNPDVTVYNGPQVISYGSVRNLVTEAIANVTSNGMTPEEVAEQLNADANAAHEESLQ